MTIDMTLWRRAAACLVTSAGVVPALGWAAGGRARGPAAQQSASRGARARCAGREGDQPDPGRVAAPGRDAHAAALADGPWMCDTQHVCLYQDSRGRGRKIQFKDYGTYKLAAYGMGAGRWGTSSYYDNQTGSAGSTLIGPNFRLPLHNFGNVPRSMNDRATYVRLYG
jgi:hypothetical protein